MTRPAAVQVKNGDFIAIAIGRVKSSTFILTSGISCLSMSPRH